MVQKLDPREALADYVGWRVGAVGIYDKAGPIHGTFLVQDIEVTVDGKALERFHAWVQRATTIKHVNPQNGDKIAFTALVQPYIDRESKRTKYGLSFPEDVRIVSPPALRVPNPVPIPVPTIRPAPEPFPLDALKELKSVMGTVGRENVVNLLKWQEDGTARKIDQLAGKFGGPKKLAEVAALIG